MTFSGKFICRIARLESVWIEIRVSFVSILSSVINFDSFVFMYMAMKCMEYVHNVN
jgi:hypothetical protein